MGIRDLFQKSTDSNEALKERLTAFLSLVTSDHRYHSRVSELTTLMEQGSIDFGALSRNLEDLTATLTDIVNGLHKLTDRRFSQLDQRLQSIYDQILERINRHRPAAVSRPTVSLSKVNQAHLDCVGWKAAQLGELKNKLNLPVPDGFAITVGAYTEFLKQNDLEVWIKPVIEGVNTNNYAQLIMVSNRIQRRIRGAVVPRELEAAIYEQFDRLQHSDPPLVSMRSSGVTEGTQFSFAGQYASFLNVDREHLIDRFKDTIASRFSPRAIYYLHTRGFDIENEPLPLCCMVMVKAEASGVVHSVNLDNPRSNTAVIAACWGFGEGIVGGTVSPDHYVIDKRTHRVVDQLVSTKKTMFVDKPDGHGTIEVDVPHEQATRAVLNEADFEWLGHQIEILETHYDHPVSLEWARDKSGKIHVLQVNLLPVDNAGPEISFDAERHPLMLSAGKTASRGVGWGPVFVIQSPSEIAELPRGAILVTRACSPDLVPALDRVNAIITDTGSATGHMATVAREFQVPMIVDTRIGSEVLSQGMEVTVDATHHKIYQHRVDELLNYTPKQLIEINSPAANALKTVLFKHVLPLNLIDPKDERFVSEGVQTYHDLTRFCHQKALEQMFYSAEEAARTNKKSLLLNDPRIPLLVYLIDLGGGLHPDHKKLTAESITSVPLRAFWDGMTSHKWPNPKPLRTKGFFSVVARTVADPSLTTRLTEKTLAIFNSEYINVSLRLGYHISNLEALCRNAAFQNYIRFHFHGGAAKREKRLRRCHIIATILKEQGFTVHLEGDTLDAIFKRGRLATTVQKLRIVGQLTALSKQLDMTLHTDKIADFFLAEFRRKIQ